MPGTHRKPALLSHHKRALCSFLFAALALTALLLFPSGNLAFDVKRFEERLAAKSLGFPRLNPNYNQTQVDLYLSQPTWQSWNLSHGGNWTAQFDTLTDKPRRVFGGAIPWVPGPANSLSGSYSAAELERTARQIVCVLWQILQVPQRMDTCAMQPSISQSMRSPLRLHALSSLSTMAT